MSFQNAHARAREHFDIIHGADCVGINGTLYYRDGARMGQSAYGEMLEPPTDPAELAKMQIVYFRERLRRAVLEFDELKRQLASQAKASRDWGYPPPPDSELERLKSMQRGVQELRAELEAAEERLRAASPAEQAAKALAAENAARCDEFANSIAHIQV